jgi:flagellar biosynthetic protein FliQ
MSADELFLVAREGLYLVLLLSAPPVLAALVVGVVMNVLQAVTQVQEQTLSFVPKLIAAFVALLLAGPWIAAQLTRFTQLLFSAIPAVGG